MAPRKCTPKRVTVYGYVKQNEGARIDDVVRNVVVKRQYRRRLPITGEFRINDKRLVTVHVKGAFRLFTNTYEGMQVAIEMGTHHTHLLKFAYYKGILDWAKD